MEVRRALSRMEGAADGAEPHDDEIASSQDDGRGFDALFDSERGLPAYLPQVRAEHNPGEPSGGADRLRRRT